LLAAMRRWGMPKLIVTLGRYSMARFLPRASISKVHGIPTRIGDLVVLPMFHPAAALHQPKYREDIEQDFGRIPSILAQKDTPSASDPVLHAEQLSLF
ncbi:MAG TPA: hypothetical protein PKJ21_02405, partial [Anaerolineae bacterium]|nr:hypothetical protein [Anaerolineae bacterium]